MCVSVRERSPFLHSLFLVLSCSHDHLHGIFVNEFLIGFFVVVSFSCINRVLYNALMIDDVCIARLIDCAV